MGEGHFGLSIFIVANGFQFWNYVEQRAYGLWVGYGWQIIEW